MAQGRRQKHTKVDDHAHVDKICAEPMPFPPIPQLQTLRFLQMSLGANISGYTLAELGLEIPKKLHHVSKGSSRKDCPYGYRVRTCNQCSPGQRIDLGTYAHVQDAVLVNDAWQLSYGDPAKLQVLRPSDKAWLHFLHVRRFLRRTSQVVPIVEILTTILGGTADLPLSSSTGAPIRPSTHSANHYPGLKRTRSSSGSYAENVSFAEDDVPSSQQLATIRYSVPTADLRLMTINHAQSLLLQISYIDRNVFSVMRVGYDADSFNAMDGQRLLASLLAQDDVSTQSIEVYKRPSSALQRIYGAMLRRLLSSLLSNTGSNVCTTEIFQQLDLNVLHRRSLAEPRAKSMRSISTEEIFRWLLEPPQPFNVMEYLEKVDIFAMNAVADAWMILSEEMFPFAIGTSEYVDDLEMHDFMAKIYELKVRREQQVRAVISNVQGLQAVVSPEDVRVSEKIAQSLMRLRAGYVIQLINIFNHEPRLYPLWGAESSDHYTYAADLAFAIPLVIGEKCQYLNPLLATVTCDARLGALVAKAWDDLLHGKMPNMNAVDAAAVDAVYRRYAVFGGLTADVSSFGKADQAAELSVIGLTTLLHYVCLCDIFSAWRPSSTFPPDLAMLQSLLPVDITVIPPGFDQRMYYDALCFLYPELTKGFILQHLFPTLDWYLNFCKSERAASVFPSGFRAIHQLYCLVRVACDDVAPGLRQQLISMCSTLLDLNRLTYAYATLLARRTEESFHPTYPQPSRTGPARCVRYPYVEMASNVGLSPHDCVPYASTERILEQACNDENFDEFFNLLPGDELLAPGPSTAATSSTGRADWFSETAGLYNR